MVFIQSTVDTRGTRDTRGSRDTFHRRMQSYTKCSSLPYLKGKLIIPFKQNLWVEIKKKI